MLILYHCGFPLGAQVSSHNPKGLGKLDTLTCLYIGFKRAVNGYSSICERLMFFFSYYHISYQSQKSINPMDTDFTELFGC